MGQARPFLRWLTVKLRWQLFDTKPIGDLVAKLGVSPLLAQCLVNRGLADHGAAATFLEPRLSNLADPFLLPDMRTAVERLFRARTDHETVVLFGDYDVDGVTATALLAQSMAGLGWDIRCYLPHRMEEGYGLSHDALANCLESHAADLLLAVDCGTTSVAPIAWLREQNLDVLILDHHQPGEALPFANAIVNPQLRDDDGPDFRELCSAGLAFKLLHALVKEGRLRGEKDMDNFDVRPWLDLVALGTIADVVPLIRENRILASAGLSWLGRSTRPGLMALKRVAGVDRKDLGVFEAGFQLAPRLNAAGRLDSAGAALDLLLAEDNDLARRLAEDLNKTNDERRQTERQIAIDAQHRVESQFDSERDFVIVEGKPEWHVGVIGIVASRVLRKFYRPTIILGGAGESLRGSGRSIEGFDLADALRACDDLLEQHGGHAMAAGVSVKPTKLNDFRKRLNEVARERIVEEQFTPPLRLDAEVELAELSLARLTELARLQPAGQGNPPVQFVVPHLELARPTRRMGRDGQHAKLWVVDGDAPIEAVAWETPNEELPSGRFDLAVAPSINEYQGRRSVQLKILDWRVSAG